MIGVDLLHEGVHHADADDADAELLQPVHRVDEVGRIPVGLAVGGDDDDFLLLGPLDEPAVGEEQVLFVPVIEARVDVDEPVLDLGEMIPRNPCRCGAGAASGGCGGT